MADQPPRPDPQLLNPFSQTIRPPIEAETIIEEVRRIPLFETSERDLPANVRQDLVLRLDDYVEPLPRFFDLESRISGMIRAGYARRNPLPVQQQRQLAEQLGLDPAFHITRPPVTMAGGFSLIGFSGVGKTTAINAILHLHEQVHSHTDFHGIPFHRTQIVWMRVACPPTGGARALLMNIFQEIDRLIGTDYHARFESGRRTAAELVPSLVSVMASLGLGMLVIDEIQRLVRLGNDEAGTLLDVFTHLRTESQIPVVLVGTPKAMKLLNRGIEQARRNTSMGNLRWEPMDNDDTWDYFVTGLWQYQWLKKPTPLTKELKDALHKWSQGITDLSVKIFKLAQFNLIGSDDERLTPEVFEHITRREFEWFPNWIPLLQMRLPELMDGTLDNPFEIDSDKKGGRKRSAAPASLTSALLSAGVKEEDLAAVVAAVASVKAKRSSEPREPDDSSAKPRKKKVAATGETALWDIVQANRNISGYDSLRQAGFVHLPSVVIGAP